MQAGVFEQKVGGLDAYSKRRLHSKNRSGSTIQHRISAAESP